VRRLLAYGFDVLWQQAQRPVIEISGCTLPVELIQFCHCCKDREQAAANTTGSKGIDKAAMVWVNPAVEQQQAM
jgi:hypothetical protein